MNPSNPTSPSDPLHDLEEVDWAALEHAYGSAEDTPDHLRRYWCGKRAETRRRGLRALSHSVYHQSGGYSASPPAMRYLLRLLAQPESHLKEDLLRLIIDLGVPGNVYDLALNGYQDPTEWLRKHYGDALDDFFACRAMYEGAIDVFIGLLDHTGARLRARAAYALALLPVEAERSLPALRARYDVEPDPITRLSITLAVAVLALSRSEAEAAALRAWLSARRQRARHPSLRVGHVIASLYALPEPPSEALRAEVIDILQGPEGCDVYPSPWLSGDLAELCGEVLARQAEAQGWPIAEVWLCAYRRWAAAHAPSTTDHQADEVGRRLMRQVVRLAAQSPALREEILTEIALRPALILKFHGELQGALRAHDLPAHLPAIVAHLGWQPAPTELWEPMSLADQLPDRPWVKTLPAPLLEANIDLPLMLLSFHPMTSAVVRAIAPTLQSRAPRGEEPWKLLGENTALRVDEETLHAFAGRWHTWDLLHNPSVEWTPERVARWPGRFNWRALSRRADFPWTEAFLEAHAESLDWGDLSMNTGLPWSEALIARHADDWSWQLLSQNPSLPWSDDLLRRFRRWHWNYLSNNNGLPWSEAFAQKHWDKLELCQLCKASAFPWTEAWIREHQHQLKCWGNLSANPGLPWSEALIRQYHDRWNWNMLSSNPALPWSAALIQRYRDRWNWESLIKNPSIPWDDDLVALLADRISPWALQFGEPRLPWRAAWVHDPRLRRLLTERDPQLYQRFIAPHLDDEAVIGIFEAAAGRVREGAEARWRQLHARRPEMTPDHPLPEALGITERLRLGRSAASPSGAPNTPPR